MRALFLFLIFVCVVSVDTIKSQNLSIGVTGNLGVSQINLLSDFPIPDYYEFDYSMSSSAGLFVQKTITKKSSLGIEILWVQIQGREAEVNKPILTSSGFERGLATEETDRSIAYIGGPIYYHLKFKNLGIKGGVQSMIYLSQKVNRKSSGVLDGEPYSYEGEWDDIRYNDFDYGLKMGLDYSLNDHLRLRADYYHGFKSIIPYWIARSLKIRQFTLGIEYDIYHL